MAKRKGTWVHLYGSLHLCIPRRARHECPQISRPSRVLLTGESRWSVRRRPKWPLYQDRVICQPNFAPTRVRRGANDPRCRCPNRVYEFLPCRIFLLAPKYYSPLIGKIINSDNSDICECPRAGKCSSALLFHIDFLSFYIYNKMRRKRKKNDDRLYWISLQVSFKTCDIFLPYISSDVSQLLVISATRDKNYV